MLTLLTQTFCLVCNTQGLWLNDNKIGDTGMIKFSEALAGGAMAQLTVRSLSTALISDPETWHAHSPDPDVLFGVQYAEALAQQ